MHGPWRLAAVVPARQQQTAMRMQARQGADFKALALEHTDKEDKLVDLGWFKRGDFMEELSSSTFCHCSTSMARSRTK